MDGAGDQLLAGTGLAAEQHRDGVVQYLADQSVDLLHGGALTDQPETAELAGCCRLGQWQIGCLQRQLGLLHCVQLRQRNIADHVQRQG